MARPFLTQDNRQENANGSWGRLRDPSEAARYRGVRELCERYGQDGFVLDVGCSQGIVQEGLTYGRYLGIDAYEGAILMAAGRVDHRTSFRQADADAFVPDSPPDVVIFNEVLYYLPRPLDTVAHYASMMADGGVLIVSLFLHTWATRRLLGQLSARYPVRDQLTVSSGSGLAWAVTAFRPTQADPLSGEPESCRSPTV